MAVDPVSTLRLAAAALAEHPDADVRAFGRWIAAFPAELAAWFGLENSSGRSGRRAALLAQRDAIIRDIRLPALRLAKELERYFSVCWPRDRLHDGCPYAADDRRALYQEIFRLEPRALTLRRIQQIRSNRATGPVFISPGAAVDGGEPSGGLGHCNIVDRAWEKGPPRGGS